MAKRKSQRRNDQLRKPRFEVGCIEITSPPYASNGGASEYAINDDCTIDADGYVDFSNCPGTAIKEVWGAIDEGLEVQGRKVGTSAWQFRKSEGTSVPGAYIGQTQTFHVRILFTNNHEDDASREFIGTGNYSSCYSSSQSPLRVGRGRVLDHPIPRRFLVALHGTNSKADPTTLKSVKKCLGSKGRVLEYDLGKSVFSEPVWNANLDEDMKLELRVRRLRSNYWSELTLQIVTRNRVKAPIIFASSIWDFKKTLMSEQLPSNSKFQPITLKVSNC